MKNFLVLLLAVLLQTSLYVNAQQPSFITDSLDNYIKQGMKDWQIPGLAIAIVKDGKPVVMKGYGVRDITSNEPVDEHTLFLIASNTKLFTGTALAELDYYNKISLDDKVGKYINGYSLYDPGTTRAVTIRDLLSHRVGTKTFQGDFVFWNSNLSRQQIIYKMRLLKPVYNFRQNYGYCNSCFVTAGEVIPVVTGKPWEVYIYDSLLMPLQMQRTSTLSHGISQMENAAKPYTTSYTGQLKELPYDHLDNFGPAASMVSNVSDLSHWLQMQLDSGYYNGKQVVPFEALQKTRDINTLTRSRKSTVYPTHFSGYGLGVFNSDYNGRQVFHHTGGADGFVTNTCFVPEEKLGITILTNNDNQSFFEALRFQILDAYTNVPYTNRSKRALAGHVKEMEATVSQVSAWQKRVKGNNPPLALTAYSGTYENDIYGPIEIKKDKNKNQLTVNFKGHNQLTATLQYMDNNEWLLTYSNIGFGILPVSFVTAGDKVTSIDIKVNEFIDYDPYTFMRK